MELTRQEAIEKHRALWHEIARRTREEKRNVDKSEVIQEGECLKSDCYLCEYASQMSVSVNKEKSACYFCPLDKPENLHCLDGLYDKWLFCMSYKEAAELADQIAELPEVNFYGD